MYGERTTRPFSIGLSFCTGGRRRLAEVDH